jgi:hypothetical protein
MTGDCHVRFCESLGVRFPRATHQVPLRLEVVVNDLLKNILFHVVTPRS